MKAAKGRPSFAVLSPGAPRETPTRTRAEELGLKIGTYPTGLLSPVAAGIKAGLAALSRGEAEAASALSPAEFRTTIGYQDYEDAPSRSPPRSKQGRHRGRRADTITGGRRPVSDLGKAVTT